MGVSYALTQRAKFNIPVVQLMYNKMILSTRHVARDSDDSEGRVYGAATNKAFVIGRQRAAGKTVYVLNEVFDLDLETSAFEVKLDDNYYLLTLKRGPVGEYHVSSIKWLPRCFTKERREPAVVPAPINTDLDLGSAQVVPAPRVAVYANVPDQPAPGSDYGTWQSTAPSSDYGAWQPAAPGSNYGVPVPAPSPPGGAEHYNTLPVPEYNNYPG